VIESEFIATWAKAARRRAGTAASGRSQTAILGLWPVWGRQAERVRWPAGHSAESVPPAARGLRGRGDERPSPSVSSRRPRLIGGNAPVQFAETCTPSSPIERLSSLPICRMAMRKKVQADYDNFLLDNSTRIARDPMSWGSKNEPW